MKACWPGTPGGYQPGAVAESLAEDAKLREQATNGFLKQKKKTGKSFGTKNGTIYGLRKAGNLR